MRWDLRLGRFAGLLRGYVEVRVRGHRGYIGLREVPQVVCLLLFWGWTSP